MPILKSQSLATNSSFIAAFRKSKASLGTVLLLCELNLSSKHDMPNLKLSYENSSENLEGRALPEVNVQMKCKLHPLVHLFLSIKKYIGSAIADSATIANHAHT